MTKVASAFYSTAVEHKEMRSLYHASFGIPGEPPMWVNDTDGKPKTFRDRDEAILAGFKVLVSKLNKARQSQDFQVRGERPPQKNTIKSWAAPPERGPTVDSVFGKK
ncbi:hypothetical protein [Bradyrhizobium ottawaense]|uniref:Uncharacterized protein n=1 Tax=Bradyrhizobium ottawaense TaxID=931866 RepID=A0ABY0P570_9BRAD|nr:hypothetical protein [Bradyrhizobium ottawaense]SDH38099.1 hypothetical protein SAMN05444163_0017 [Bradyrhizobium ottawaense]SDK46387.1 hypothetical protein SAMN05444163_8176 [Bradyrhizobium ottawaense]